MSQRVSAIFARLASPDVSNLPVSDGRATIGEKEASALVRTLASDSFAADAKPTRATLIGAPGRFESLETYAAFADATLRGRASASASSPRARERDDGGFDISVVVGGSRVVIGAGASPDGEAPTVLVAGGGRYVVWEVPGEVGGFENEGQGLLCYDVRSGLTTRVMDEYFSVERMREVTMDGGRSYIAVEMSDSGAGGSHVALVDPARGTVFHATDTALVSLSRRAVHLRNADGERFVVDANALAHQTVVTNEPDEFADDALRIHDVTSLFDSGGFTPVNFEGIDNPAVEDVVERLRSEAETFTIDNAYAEAGFVETYRATVTNEYGFSFPVFAVRTTLGGDSWTYFVNESGQILLRRTPETA